ncbi:MAG: DUF3596 domain-containing protein [Magnetococcus sp. THC-1_WYH]
MGGRGTTVGGIRPRGKCIQIDFYYRGVRCRETLKIPPTKANLAYAVRLKATIEHEIAKGVFNFLEHFPDSKRAMLFDGHKATRKTVSEALLQYLEGVKRGCADSTWKDYKSAIHYHLIPTFGQLLLRNLTTAQIRAWLTNLKIGNKRINNILVPLRGMLKDAHADGFIDRNPMDRIRNLHVTIEDPAPFVPEEITAILDALIDNPQARNMIQFAFWTGLRTSELLAIEWGDIDWKRGMAVIRRANVRGHHKEPKTQSSARDILLLPDAMNALLDQKKHSFLEGGVIFRNS